INPRVPNQEFTVPPSNDSLFDFILELGYKGIYHKANVDYAALIWEDLQAVKGSPYHTVDKDGVFDRWKFISKGEMNQVYGKFIPDTLITDDIHNSKATVTPKKATTTSKKKKAKKIESSDEESDEQEERMII
ncbi:hypothetical protein Tco_0239750, partial [Tanacetum coccineum]